VSFEFETNPHMESHREDVARDGAGRTGGGGGGGDGGGLGGGGDGGLGGGDGQSPRCVWETQCEAVRGTQWETQCEAVRGTQWETQCEAVRETQWETQCEAVRETQWETQCEAVRETQWETQCEAVRRTQWETQCEAVRRTQWETQCERRRGRHSEGPHLDAAVGRRRRRRRSQDCRVCTPGHCASAALYHAPHHLSLTAEPFLSDCGCGERSQGTQWAFMAPEHPTLNTVQRAARWVRGAHSSRSSPQT
jgi:hypothetical protein